MEQRMEEKLGLVDVGKQSSTKLCVFVVFVPNFRTLREMIIVEFREALTTEVIRRAKEKFYKIAEKGDRLLFLGVVAGQDVVSFPLLPAKIEGLSVIEEK